MKFILIGPQSLAKYYQYSTKHEFSIAIIYDLAV